MHIAYAHTYLDHGANPRSVQWQPLRLNSFGHFSPQNLLLSTAVTYNSQAVSDKHRKKYLDEV